MPISRWNQITIGLPVSIVLKPDQRTGRQVQGTVAQLLTKHDHPRGIKVKLTDGRVGRVQQILPTATSTARNQSQLQSGNSVRSHLPKDTNTRNAAMADNNPWASSVSQGNPYLGDDANSHPPSSRNTNTSSNPAAGQHDEWQAYQSNPYQAQQPQQQPQQEQPWYNTGDGGEWGSEQRVYGGNNTQNTYQPPSGPPPSQQPLRRSSTEEFLARESDRGEQFEHMQQFESQSRITEDDRNQAQLQKEFPGIDSSLIAALYSDTKDLVQTRELLQELNSGN